jgi:hypothetical protein
MNFAYIFRTFSRICFFLAESKCDSEGSNKLGKMTRSNTTHFRNLQIDMVPFQFQRNRLVFLWFLLETGRKRWRFTKKEKMDSFRRRLQFQHYSSSVEVLKNSQSDFWSNSLYF